MVRVVAPPSPVPETVRPCSARNDLLASFSVAVFLLAPAIAAAQVSSLDLALEHVIRGGTGVERSCLEPGHSTAIGARLAHGISRRLAVAVATRAFIFESASTCVDGFPPPDGTYIQDDRVALLAATFLTSDIRLRVSLGASIGGSGLEVGFGNAWRSGHDLPYVLLGASVPIPTGQKVRLVIEAEYLVLRVTSDRYRRTWQNFQLVAEDSLGQIHEWSDALAVGVGVRVAF